MSVARRFGIAQFQPDAQVFARAKRWKVIGLDTASPWNPRDEGPSWSYRVCVRCKQRYRAEEPRCPRCKDGAPGPTLPAAEFGGFLARRDESPILDEEDRFATRNLVKVWPQWDGEVAGRWVAGPGWALRWSRREEVQWINEGVPPTPVELQNNVLCLHQEAKGYLLCGACGRMLTPPPPPTAAARGRRQPRTAAAPDPYGHWENCPRRGTPPRPLGIATVSTAEVLRLLVPVPASASPDDLQSWGLSLGYAVRAGMRLLYALDEAEIEFEGPWITGEGTERHGRIALSFIDPNIGGSGYLPRIADQFHLVARRALDHLAHEGCESACYRCLKSYQNQRYHDRLCWPRVVADLEALAERPPEPRPLEVGDLDDPRPWLEAYAAGVGSPLELRFLRLFEEHGFHPAKQVPVAPSDGEPAISVADFAVPERRLAIYVDGAAFHVGQNLRRDRFIRERLRGATPPWRVEELRASDLRSGRELVQRLVS